CGRNAPSRRRRSSSRLLPSRELECLLACRNRADGALLGDLLQEASDLGPGRQAQLVPADERLVEVGGACVLDRRRELSCADEGEHVECPGLRGAPKAVDRAGGAVRGTLRAEEDARVAAGGRRGGGKRPTGPRDSTQHK